MADHANIYPFFVGAYGENDEFLEKIFLEFLRDHIYWRRNFHPEDRWRIPTQAQYSDDFFSVHRKDEAGTPFVEHQIKTFNSPL